MSDDGECLPAVAAAVPKQGSGGDRESTGDPWIGTVTNVSGFLVGFSLASVVVITDGPGHFQWPGVSVLALTIASVVLLVTAQEARRADRTYPGFSRKWHDRIWAVYHAGIVALLAGLGAALAPQPGMGTQQPLRWVAVGLAFAAALVEAGLAVWAARKATSKR